MKSLVQFAFLILLALRSFGHGGAPLGPQGGRLLDFSKDQSIRGEVTLVDGMFRVALLDKNLKPIELNGQVLTVSGGDRRKPEKPVVRQEGGRFVFAALKGDEYPLVLQFKPARDGKTVTAKFTYDASVCSACNHAEWLCQCPAHEEKKGATPK